MKKVLFVVGSLREGSFNRQMAQVAEKMLEGKAEVSYLDYSQIPLFSQDLEKEGVPAVDAARKEAQAADAIWIFSPIYNWNIPGTIKNTFDWLSRSLDPTNPSAESAIHDKFVTVSILGNSGQEQLVSLYQGLLPAMRLQVIGEFTATRINDSAWGTGKIELTEEASKSLEHQVSDILKAIEA
ncbi:TPA: NADPH-dependent FMN reductase [Streptococcus suis]